MSRVTERPRAVVFDLDGTLVDSYGAIADALNHARRWRGLPALDEDTVRRSVGHGLESLIARWVGPDVVEPGVARFRERYAACYAERTRALPGAVTTVADLRRRGFRLAVASNKPARFSRPILEGLGMSESIEVVHGPDTVGSAKPEPAMIRRCLSDLACAERDAVYVGDMVLDVESARRAGVDVVLVRGGSSDEAELRATGARVLDRLAALLDWVDGRGRRPAARESEHAG